MTSKFGGVEVNDSNFGGVPVELELPQRIGGQGSRFGGVPLSTIPQVDQPISSDLKDKLNDTPWYEFVLYDINKVYHNAFFGATEGVAELGTDLLNLFGAEIENPLAAGKSNPLRDLSGATVGVSPKEYEESTVRDIARVGAQIAPVGAAVSAATKIPKIAQAVSKVPKAARLPIGAALQSLLLCLVTKKD